MYVIVCQLPIGPTCTVSIVWCPYLGLLMSMENTEVQTLPSLHLSDDPKRHLHPPHLHPPNEGLSLASPFRSNFSTLYCYFTTLATAFKPEASLGPRLYPLTQTNCNAKQGKAWDISSCDLTSGGPSLPQTRPHAS